MGRAVLLLYKGSLASSDSAQSGSESLVSSNLALLPPLPQPPTHSARHATARQRPTAQNRPTARPALPTPPTLCPDSALPRRPDRYFRAFSRCVSALVCVWEGELIGAEWVQESRRMACCFMTMESRSTASCLFAPSFPRLDASQYSLTNSRLDAVQVRRWVDQHTASFFTLTPSERRYVSYSSTGVPIAGPAPAPTPAAEGEVHGVKPDTHTPFEYFKEHPVRFGGKEKEGEKEAGSRMV